MLKTIKTIIEIKMPFKLAVKVLAIGLIENLVNLPKNLILGIITLFNVLQFSKAEFPIFLFNI